MADRHPALRRVASAFLLVIRPLTGDILAVLGSLRAVSWRRLAAWHPPNSHLRVATAFLPRSLLHADCVRLWQNRNGEAKGSGTLPRIF
ncbi:hypothetical protein QBC34DRAFT_403521 [Podospora aff. communis PSN243]|uniref:Secreted protein n=1 Tax=Podospora aff. communis PSN243 TaxID=3040156 RepID=A0AAV9GR75_9PEZI|nr:hypothetical protein QBC34DRAFT_403521 [Podospora aff. communis PSN243]